MRNDYELKYLEGVNALPLSGEFDPAALPEPWKGLNEARLNACPWGGEYRPACGARVGWNESGIHVLMYAKEPEIRAEVTEIGGAVCTDSCLEFFLAPDAEKPLYVNCEVNPLCVMHIGLGEGRHGRTVLKAIPEGFNAARLTAYHFDGDTATVVKGTAENGEYVFTADKFSPYALVDLSTGNGLSGNTGLPGNNTLPSGNKSLNGNSGLSGNGSLTLKNGGATGNQSLATGNASLKNGNAHTPQTGDERGNVITVVAVLTVVNAALFAGVMIATKKKKGKEEA